MSETSFKKVPRHVGIIMDGNGRWATMRGHKRSYGHKKGAEAVSDVMKTAFACGVEVVSLYALSTENLDRPKEEVRSLMELLKDGMHDYGAKALKEKVRLTVSGDLSVFDDKTRADIDYYVAKTKTFTAHTMNVCLNYGARSELCRAFSLMQKDGVTACDENTVNKYLYTSDFPDVDLVIRTAGEQRLSNFLLWQCAYAEFYFTDVLWPDFSKEETLKALEWFDGRKRRFGKLDNA